MKKFLTTCLALSVFALTGMVSVGSVSASDLSTESKIQLSSSLGNLVEFSDVTYVEKDGYDYNEFTMTTSMTDSLINQVLNNNPGVTSSLGIYYFTIKPDITSTDEKYYKANEKYDWNREIDQSIIDELKAKVDNESQSSSPTVYGVNLRIQYKDAEGNWKNVTDKQGDSKVTIGENLKTHVSGDVSAATYGINYRFYTDTKKTVAIWKYKSGGEDKYEFIVSKYSSKFGVTSVVGDDSVYYPTLKQALESSDVSKIIIKDDQTIDEDIVIPKNVTVDIQKDVKITLAGGVKIANYGTINNKGTIKNSDGKELHVINVVSENGTVELSKTTALAGDEVTIKTTANNGYELKNVKVASGNTEIEVKDGKFTMPDNDVYVTATFEKIAAKGDEKNPKTGDNAIIYFMLAMLGLGVTGLTAKKVFSK